MGEWEGESAAVDLRSNRAPTLSPSHARTDFHAIRLRGPWDYEVLSQAAPRAESAATGLPPTGRVTMPTDWGPSLGADFRGRVRYIRRFNGPTGVAPQVRVWIVFDGADAWAEVALNDGPLGRVDGPSSRAEFDVTPILRQHNVITAIVEKPPNDTQAGEIRAGGLVGEVRLEFRGPNAGWLDQEKVAERERDWE